MIIKNTVRYMNAHIFVWKILTLFTLVALNVSCDEKQASWEDLGDNIIKVFGNEDYDSDYKFLETHKAEISETEYNSSKERISFLENNESWLKIAVCAAFIVILIVLIIICRQRKRILKSGHYIDKHSSGKAYLYELLGGIFGFHYAYLASASFVVHWVLSLLIVLSTFQFMMFPSSLWNENIPILTKISGFGLVAILIFDVVRIPYRIYVLKCEYYRRDLYESDILQGRKTDLEQTCDNIKVGLPQLANELGSLINKAVNIGNKRFVTNESGLLNWIKKKTLNDGSIEFEMDRLDDISEIQYKIEDLFGQLEVYSNQLGGYLEIERISAMKNLICAKELMGTIKKISKSQNQTLVKDSHTHYEKRTVKIDNSLYTQVHFDFDTMERNCLSAITNLNTIGTESSVATTAVRGVYAVSEIIETTVKKKRKKEALQSAIVKIVLAIQESGRDFAKYKAELLRYEELLSALFFANKAFVKSYSELRDTIYTKTNFFNFLFHRINRKTIKRNREKINVKLATLQEVCSSYNKINKTTL